MKLAIRGVVEPGNLEKERLVLRAEVDGDIGRFLVTRNAYLGEGSVSDVIQNAFWLPDQSVEAGHLVVLYTKSGENRIRINKDESKTHFLYLGLDEPIWESDDAAVLIEIATWQMKKVS